MADRISNLPDPILCDILSFLPTKLAVSTTVLSHRWKSLHLHLPTLYFEDETFQHFKSFIRFLSTKFYSREITVPIHSFTFKRDSSFRNQRIVNIILIWIFERLRLDNLRFLEIAFHENLNARLPKHISCKNLQVLKLNYVIMTDINISTELDFEFRFDFPLLKVLHWNTVKFPTPDSFLKFMSSCPILEELHACNSRITSVEDESNENFKLFPNLKTARIFDNNVPITVLSEVQSLHLELNMNWIRCKQLPLFRRLVNIDIIYYNELLEGPLKWLLQLLQHCLILQNFTIQYYVDHQSELVGDYWIDPPTVPQCLSSQLKTFFLGGYGGNENEFQFVRYIMQNSKVLQTMTIESNPLVEINIKHQMLMKLSSTTMTSTTCKLLFD
ncbi:putative FBD-associated F-box protein At3g50710 [Vicia villosa]|uniref:putative FBD-associated F-box protein At3g50710 n=1 Tax=Vicia villosa TaxID=3911 RepID=UPI00273C7DEA|nr:putative FBD-associated F-box protein At3g50710 [Vicia villosa]